MSPQVQLALIDTGKTLVLAVMLLWHMHNRRYPQDRNTATLRAWIGYYLGELLLGAALVPSLVSIAKLIPGTP